ncbi:MAG: copper chaperone PCu(A)C [Anaerolineae bacterium]
MASSARPTAAEHTEMNMAGMDMGTSGVFMTIENLNDFPLTLLSAATDAAALVELHQSTVVNDVMQMGPVEGGLEIAAGATLNFEDEGYHFMLMDLTDELVAGDAISVTLTFARPEGENFEVVIGAAVQQVAPEASSIVAIGAWARPTVTEAPAADMPMGEPEATPEAMQMGEAISKLPD